MTVHQIAAGAAPRDAITNHLLLSRDLLRAHGYASEIFAEHIHPDLAGDVRPATEMEPDPSAAAILHYSIESVAFDLALDAFSRTALHYHNITPADLLWRFAPGVAPQCAAGRRELGRFARAVDRACADSEFNAQELRLLGAEDARAVGILRRALEGGGGPAHESAPPNPEAPQLLFVGRGIPNKAQHDLVLALAALHEAGCIAELSLIGSWGSAPAYERHCRELARHLGVADHVRFVGGVSDEALRAAYRDADVFLCLSDHEGFCVPVLEALDAGLPVIGFDAGAVPETLGDAGLVLPGKEPSLVAEAVVAVVANASLREAMTAGAAARLEHFSPGAVGDRLLEFVREVVA